MKTHISTGLAAFVGALALASAGSLAQATPSHGESGFQHIQYNQYQDQRQDPYYQGQRPDGYNQDQRGGGYYQDQGRGGYNGDFRGPAPRWRPGQVVPGQLMNLVVQDWEERGLSRPPGGHQWFRVRQQFLLIRTRDRMIARILTFD